MRHSRSRILLAAAAAFPAAAGAGEKLNFSRDIRPILSENCIACHGPDDKKREAGLRLDDETAAKSPAEDGGIAVVPGDPDRSLIIKRITSSDPDEVMPPPKFHKTVTPEQTALLRRWISEGAPWGKHWAYEPVTRPQPPQNGEADPIDAFLLAQMQREGLTWSPEADRATLIRRVTLDLTGLPPEPAEVEAFVNDTAPGAWARLVDRLLASPAYGEHWARQWLDMARYADSAGYADDPSRDIWPWRDWVVRAINSNMPFDQFTVEQMAGDLLPGAADEQVLATGFHRNTLTNNEGGTNDEEFRTVAVVDRVNTTMAVWMGTSMACAQCHTHKYDPITHHEYFQFLAFFNNTADADRRDESPLIEVLSDSAKARRAALRQELAAAEFQLANPGREVLAEQQEWEKALSVAPAWTVVHPGNITLDSGAPSQADESGRVVIKSVSADKDNIRLKLKLPPGQKQVSALQIETIPDPVLPGGGAGHGGGNFVLTDVQASLEPPRAQSPLARYVRIELPGTDKFLHLAEVEVFSGGVNIARTAKAAQSSTDFEGPAGRAIDGNTDGEFERKSVTHTAAGNDPWLELDLGTEQPVDRVVVWNRTDSEMEKRLRGWRLILLDAGHREIAMQQPPLPEPDVSTSWNSARPLGFSAAGADYSQNGFSAENLTDRNNAGRTGWAVGGAADKTHRLILTTAAPVSVPEGAGLAVTLQFQSPHPRHVLGSFRVAVTGDARAADYAALPESVRSVLAVSAAQRTHAQQQTLCSYYSRNIAPGLKSVRDQIAALEKKIAAVKPDSSPVFRELPAKERRKTHVQLRGNWLDLGDEVTEGVPAVFPPLPPEAPRDRLSLARWLIDPKNPLTPRVTANRLWEAVFGIGIVRSSEEFGSQGDLPTHPDLLDWLADEMLRLRWDQKAFLRALVLTRAYRQDSRVSAEMAARDPDNRWLARGPRFRMSAEVIRDQALAVSGLLSRKMYGPPVRPPRPSSGLTAAFGGSTDWQTSDGEDRHRRALYTEVRRTSPYPSFSTFDAPSREICTLRRSRTNTPLQAFVTLNDPVFVEAAQALARRMLRDAAPSAEARLNLAFSLTLSRAPQPVEIARLTALYEASLADFRSDPPAAVKLATEPVGALPPGADAADLAAWTTVANVVLNLDEFVMRR